MIAVDEYDEMLGAARYKAERDVALQELDRLKRKTCHIDSYYIDDPGRHKMIVYMLSCGHDVETVTSPEPRYCPYCGAKVVDK